jgi:hypothetical protein
MRCSFCALEARNVRSLFFEQGREAICDECLEVCRDIIRNGHDVAPTSPTPPRRSLPAPPQPSEVDDVLAGLPERSWSELQPLLVQLGSRIRPELPLICSFCGAERCAKLIAGPRVFICDRCVAQATAMLQQDARLIEFQPEQIFPWVPKPESHAPILSEDQRIRLLDAVRQEVRRRHDALWSAIVIAAAPAARAAADVEDTRERAMDAEMMLSGESRQIFDAFAPHLVTLSIIGGTSEQRRRLARRAHEACPRKGPFVRIDCVRPGALSRLREAENGTVVLENVPSLSSTAQQFLSISLFEPADLWPSARIVCTIDDVGALDARIERGEFSSDLSDSLRALTISISA